MALFNTGFNFTYGGAIQSSSNVSTFGNLWTGKKKCTLPVPQIAHSHLHIFLVVTGSD